MNVTQLTSERRSGKHLLQVEGHGLGGAELGGASSNSHIDEVGDHCKVASR
jgi:hypothetical protein